MKKIKSTRDSTNGATRITHSSIIGKGKIWDISVQIIKETSETWITTTSDITTHNQKIVIDELKRRYGFTTVNNNHS